MHCVAWGGFCLFLAESHLLGGSSLAAEKPGAFQLLLKRIRFIFLSFDHSWENFTFLKEARSAGWERKHPDCDLSLPL